VPVNQLIGESMRKSLTLLPVFRILGLLLCLPVYLVAQKIESSLDIILLESPPDSAVTVLVRPALEVEINGLESDLDRLKVSRAERHRRVIEALKKKSETAQSGLRAYLSDARKSGKIRKYRQFWIDNLVAVTARPDVVREIAARSDVAQILENKILTLQADKKKSDVFARRDATALAGSAYLAAGKVTNWALDTLKVRGLWKRGLTGRGILVGTIDSGVDGTHPALAAKWRGANGATDIESWYDSWNENSYFPVDDDPSLGPTHGTMVMGCLLGQTGADTVGAAPDAQWISANAFEYVGGIMTTMSEKIISCFEWMADPDGDPGTIDDVPDILNLSFAESSDYGCSETYRQPVKNMIALGVTVIIAAGNKAGRGDYVGSPGSYPDFFAVGSVDSLNFVSEFSTRGPSTCNSSVYKPDVVAPGEGYLSTQGSLRGGGYNTVKGTSFATPLVAGIAVLLKQYNPELTPNEITQAIRSSARDLGPVTGPDNDYGYGLVNAEAALAKVTPASTPSFAILNIDLLAGSDSLISPGEQVSVILRVTDLGAGAGSVSGTVTPNSSDVSVISGTANFGDFLPGDVKSNSLSPFVLSFEQNILIPAQRTFKVTFISGTFSKTVSFALSVGGQPEPPVEGMASHNVGKAGLTLTNFGVIGKIDQKGGGFVYPYGDPSASEQLFQGSILVATGPENVSDATYNDKPMTSGEVTFDHDFTTTQGGNIKVLNPGLIADQEITGAYADSRAVKPLGVSVHQRSYAYATEGDNDYVIVEYTLTGPENSEINGVYAAQHIDWDVAGTDSDDLVGFDRNLSLAYMYDSKGNMYVGHALLTQAVSGFKPLNFNNDIKNGFTGAEKFTAMTSLSPDTVTAVSADWSELLSGGPVNIRPGEEVTVAFAVIGGTSLAALKEHTLKARAKFHEIALLKGLDLVPPRIVADTRQDADLTDTSYAVRAAITDEKGVETVDLWWWVVGLTTFWRKTVMAPSGTGDIYEAQIPRLGTKAQVNYYLQAIDNQGNQAFWPEGAPQVYSTFEIRDLNVPLITGIAVYPDTGGTSGGFVVSAEVQDNNLARVYALLVIGDNARPDTLDLVPRPGTGTFAGIVKDLPRGTRISYYIAVEDGSGNLAKEPADAPQSLLSFDFLPLISGDGDLNGKVDIFDLLAMLKVLAGKPSDWEQSYVMDLNRNGRIDIFDLIKLLRLLSGNTSLAGNKSSNLTSSSKSAIKY